MTEKQSKASAWLNRAHDVEETIKALERVREKNRSIAERCTASYEGEGCGSPSKDNSQEKIIHQLCDDSSRITERLGKLLEVRSEIGDVIKSVGSSKIEAVLSMRYLAYMRINDIADQLGVDRKTVNRRHLKGLEIIYEKIQNGY